MKRLLFTLAASLSLLLLLITLTLWIRSHYTRDIIGFGQSGGHTHLAQSILGRIHILSTLENGGQGGTTYSSDRLSPQAIWNGGMSSYPIKVEWHWGLVYQNYTRYRMGWGSTARGFTTRHRLIVVHYAHLSTLFAPLPALWLIAWIRSPRHQPGHCPACGYDLRATPDRCPECGRVIVGNG